MITTIQGLRASPVAPLIALLTVLSWLSIVGCGRTDQRPGSTIDQTATTEEVSTEPRLDSLTVGLLSEFKDLFCRHYERWPSHEVAGSRVNWEQWLEGLDSNQRELLSQHPLGHWASDMCPRAIPQGSVTVEGYLPALEETIPSIPGTFVAAEASSAEELRVRFEWTAIGLGCLGLDLALDEDQLSVLGESFVSRMGYTLKSYVQASLALDDYESSERIFRRIVFCAEQHALQPEP